MATTVLHPEPVPEPASISLETPPSSSSVLDEVRAAHQSLRSRLAGAVTGPLSPPSPSTNLENDQSSPLTTVPLIDLAPSFDRANTTGRAEVAAQIRAACLTTGFFQIANHGVTGTAQARILEQARRFFHDLSGEKKSALHIRHSEYFRGWEPSDASYTGDDVDVHGGGGLGAETTINSRPETKEGFNWGYETELDPTGGDGGYVELDSSTPPMGHGYNVWPDERDLPGFRAGVAEYYGQVLGLARHLFRLFALSLGLEEHYFDPVTTHPGGIGRLLYYPPAPAKGEEGDEEEEGKLGLGAHTDYECFTLLLSSANPGLEILFPPAPSITGHDYPVWRPCPVRPGTLTVNVADFLMRWTGGLYRSTVHRVVTRPGTGERYSVPFFFSINYDAEVGELPVRLDGLDVNELKRYKPMKAGEYVLERLRATRTVEQEEEEARKESGL